MNHGERKKLSDTARGGIRGGGHLMVMSTGVGGKVEERYTRDFGKLRSELCMAVHAHHTNTRRSRQEDGQLEVTLNIK